MNVMICSVCGCDCERNHHVQKYCKLCAKEKRKESQSILDKKRWEENKEQEKARGKKYREKNKDRINEKTKKYREKNKDIIRENYKKYYEKNKDRLRECKKKWLDKNQEHHKEYNKKWHEKNKEKTRESKKEHIKYLSDWYVADKLKIPVKECTKELIEMSRKKIILFRTVKKHKNEKTN
jgi:hypothetical protein